MRKAERNTKHKAIKNVAKKRGVRYSPVPEFITCPGCGFDVELWSDGEETRCLFCGHKFFKKEATIH